MGESLVTAIAIGVLTLIGNIAVTILQSRRNQVETNLRLEQLLLEAKKTNGRVTKAEGEIGEIKINVAVLSEKIRD